jgi:hypothetical protein
MAKCKQALPSARKRSNARYRHELRGLYVSRVSQLDEVAPSLSLIAVPVTSKERSNLWTGSEYLVTPTSAVGWDCCWVMLLRCCWGISDTLRHQLLKILATTGMTAWYAINCKGFGRLGCSLFQGATSAIAWQCRRKPLNVLQERF